MEKKIIMKFRTNKRWSKLQCKFYSIIDKKLDLQLHLSIYRMKSYYGSTDLPRYWITLGKEIIFDYPVQFMDEPSFYHTSAKYYRIPTNRPLLYDYPYANDVTDIGYFIDEYINTPRSELLTKDFTNDFWGLSNILKFADRRVGKRALENLKDKIENPISKKIIELRLDCSKS